MQKAQFQGKGDAVGHSLKLSEIASRSLSSGPDTFKILNSKGAQVQIVERKIVDSNRRETAGALSDVWKWTALK